MSEYKVVSKFECGGNKMVVVADTKSACVMTRAEWLWIESREISMKRKLK